MNGRSAYCRGCGSCDVEKTSSVHPPDLTALVESVVRNVVEELLPARESAGTIPIGVSARHIHLRQDHLEELFGPGYELTKLRDLNQPGEFAAHETLSVVGPKRRLFEQVRILGPVRSITQVELSYSDGVYLGMDLPHRLSGNIRGSAPVILIGPQGILNLPEGAIRAVRHVHISPEDARRLEVEDGQKISVESWGPLSVTFNNVIVRVGANLNLEMHVDTDEANAAGLRCGDPVRLVREERHVENELVGLSRAV